MAEIINEQEEKEFARKYKAKKRIRGLLIIINGLLVCYLLFLVGDVIVDFYNYQVKGDENNFVTLCNRNRSNSQKLYREYLEKTGEESSTEIGDLAVYGQYLHLSKEAFDLPSYQEVDNIQLINVCSKTPVILASLHYNTTAAPVEKLNEGINLQKLDIGEYLVFQNYISASNYGELVKVASGKENVKHTLYTLPDKDNHRKMITIYAYPQNEALVIKVRKITKLPAAYYDFVVFGDEAHKEQVAASLSKYNVRYFAEDVSLKSLYETSANYAISLLNQDEEKITTSNYIKDSFAKDSLLTEAGRLTDYDANKYIRELGGYAMRAGARQFIQNDEGSMIKFEESFEIANLVANHDLGKQTYLVSLVQEQSNLEDLLLEIINEVNG